MSDDEIAEMVIDGSITLRSTERRLSREAKGDTEVMPACASVRTIYCATEADSTPPKYRASLFWEVFHGLATRGLMWLVLCSFLHRPCATSMEFGYK